MPCYLVHVNIRIRVRLERGGEKSDASSHWPDLAATCSEEA